MVFSNSTSHLFKVPISQLEQSLGYSDLACEWLAGDGSDRSYFRVRAPEQGKSWVLMQLGPADEQMLKTNDYCWPHLACYLLERGVKTPEITRQWPEFGSILIEDCGNETFESRVFSYLKSDHKSKVADLYRQAFGMIGGFLSSPSDGEKPWTRRSFDREKFEQELHFFRSKYLQETLNLFLVPSDMKRFQHECARLSEDLAKESRFLVHRDFHSRNIMIHDDELISIDFQDARLGPASYDLVSLCFDPYIPFDFEFRLTLMSQGLSTLKGLCDPSILENINRTWKNMALQRLIKAVGSYGYIATKKNDPGWLEYVTPSLRMITALDSDDFLFLSKELPAKILKLIHR